MSGSTRRAGDAARLGGAKGRSAIRLQGFTLEDVKNLLGHSSIVLTSNTYEHVLERRQVAVARGMDAVLGG